MKNNIYMYNWITLLYSKNYIVNQLHFNKLTTHPQKTGFAWTHYSTCLPPIFQPLLNYLWWSEVILLIYIFLFLF